MSSTNDTTITSLLNDLVANYDDFDPNESELICHTSSIPLATNFDLHRDRQGPEHTIKAHHRCHNANCMFYSEKQKFHCPEHLTRGCPCNKELPSICWIGMMKEMTFLNENGSIDGKKVAFCPDARNILEDNYPVEMKNKTEVTGFEKVNNLERLINVLEETYWFAKFRKQFKIDKALKGLWKFSKQSPGENGKVLRSNIEAILKTVNGLIVKKIVFMGRECVGYKKLSESTAQVFRDLCIEYSAMERYSLPHHMSPLYEEAKAFFQHCKRYFNHDQLEQRLRIFAFKFKNKALKNFFIPEMMKIRAYITKVKYQKGEDVTTSLHWKFRWAHLHQTRTLDHLPFYMAREMVAQYIETMERALKVPTEYEMNLTHTCVLKNLKDNKVEKGLYRKENFELNEKLFRDAIALEIKATASFHHMIIYGGKLEDARIFLQFAKKYGWRFKIRDLRTGAIIGETPLITEGSWDEKGILNLSSVIFWGALQVATNFLCIHQIIDEENYVPLYKEEEWYDEEFNHASMIGIDEPGKLRMLIKTNSMLNWSLSLGAKLIQKGLATHPDHKAGLELGAQEWNFSKRISGESNESWFLYDRDGQLKSTARLGQSDWSKATDMLGKMLGYQAMKTFMIYTDFPSWYGNIFLEISRLQIHVREVSYFRDDTEIKRYETNHIFREGFMMGVQGAKGFLHLAHVASQGLGGLYLENLGFVFDKIRRDQRYPRDKLHPDRGLEGIVYVH